MDYAKLTNDLKEARMAALIELARSSEDGGTGNLDTPVLILKNARFDRVKAAAESAGVSVSKWDSGVYHIYGSFLIGMANLRNRMAETFAKSLRDNGWEAYVYYVID